ncbi:flagellar motor switch protein FliM [Alicyclobacillaceae bacterium I2511]|nr:flagellar motor switch protein FliM [Alicyclobacillaceae bacterium I2511]
MSDVLSQSEIDALLSALSSGEVRAEDIRENPMQGRVRNYDFRRAMRFSKDHIRMMTRIHDHFARLLTTYLSGQLRAVVQVQVHSVDQLPYDEFIRSIPALTVIQVLEYLPLPGRLIMEMNPQIVFAVMDRLMGGDARGMYRERELTEIERTLLQRVLEPLPQFLRESWDGVDNIVPQLLSVESNPQFLQLTTPNETVLVVTLNAKIGAVSGFINFCIPHLTLEPVMSKLSSQQIMGGVRLSTERVVEERGLIETRLRNASVVLSALLGESQLPFLELLQLQPGDVLGLNAPINQPIPVYVDGQPTFGGFIGTYQNHYAVRIVGDVEEVKQPHEPTNESFAGGN